MPNFTRHTYDYQNLKPLQFLHTDLDLECMGIGLGRMEPGQGYPFWHTHEQQEEVYICIEGTLTLLVDEDELTLHAGDIVRVSPEAKRAVGNRTPAPGTILIVGAMPYEGYDNSEGRSHIGDGQHTEDPPPDWTVGS